MLGQLKTKALQALFFFVRLFKQLNESGNFVRIPLPAKGRLYASPMPYGPYDKFNTVIRFYRRNHIDAAVVLVTAEEIKKKCSTSLLDVYRKRGIEPIHVPIPDLTAPSLDTVSALIDTVCERLAKGQRLVIHCNAGVGRTGVVAACVAHRLLKVGGEEALEYVRQHLHINITTEQKRFVSRWCEADVMSAG